MIPDWLYALISVAVVVVLWFAISALIILGGC